MEYAGVIDPDLLLILGTAVCLVPIEILSISLSNEMVERVGPFF